MALPSSMRTDTADDRGVVGDKATQADLATCRTQVVTHTTGNRDLSASRADITVDIALDVDAAGSEHGITGHGSIDLQPAANSVEILRDPPD